MRTEGAIILPMLKLPMTGDAQCDQDCDNCGEDKRSWSRPLSDNPVQTPAQREEDANQWQISITICPRLRSHLHDADDRNKRADKP